MSDRIPFNPYDLYGALFGVRKSHLSAAGEMLAGLDRADKKVESEGISEELHAALRRADIRSRWEAQP